MKGGREREGKGEEEEREREKREVERIGSLAVSLYNGIFFSF